MTDGAAVPAGLPVGLPPNQYNAHAWIVGEPEIGAGTWIGAFTVIDGSGGLSVGVGCDISSGAQIYTHSSVRRCVSGRAFAEVERRPTRIGDRVFIGANAVVNMGVTIGDEAVVAAGAVVTRDVPARTVVAGVPARPVATVVLADIALADAGLADAGLADAGLADVALADVALADVALADIALADTATDRTVQFVPTAEGESS